MDCLQSLEIGGKIHKEIHNKILDKIKPGMKIIDLVKLIETETINLCKNYDCINYGIGFPCGISINNCVAHYHPNMNIKYIFDINDVIKIDYGIEINGWIVDSAFTHVFNDNNDILLKAVNEATEMGLKTVGVDVDIRDWAVGIQEVMESYDSISVIGGLGGHNIKRGIIHGGMFLPCKDLGYRIPNNYRFKEGVYAIETFGSNGTTKLVEGKECNLFRLNPDSDEINNELYKEIKNRFSTLPFCSRYIKNNKDIDILIENNKVLNYPPLYIRDGFNSAQFEKTLYLDENKKVIV